MKGLDKSIKILFAASLVLMILNLANIFMYTPVEASQGIMQKIFYVHVPCAFNMYLGFAIGFVFSLLYLWKRNDRFDQIAYSAIEVGFVFACCVLLSGPVWAKGAWGKYWDFDPRLTSTLVIWFIYFSYILLRRYFGAAAKSKIFGAIIAIIGFLDVPVIHYSVKIWRGVHPNVISKKASSGGLPPSMLRTFLISSAVFLIVYAFIFLLRLRREIVKRNDKERSV